MLAQLAERFGWRCHICRRKVNPLLSGLHPRGPTLDHLNPWSAGGSDALDNLAIAHRACNIRRGAGGTAQLVLPVMAA